MLTIKCDLNGCDKEQSSHSPMLGAHWFCDWVTVEYERWGMQYNACCEEHAEIIRQRLASRDKWIAGMEKKETT